VRAVSRLFFGLSLHGPVVKINMAMHRCLRGQWGKAERREKRLLLPEDVYIVYKGKLSKDLMGWDEISSDYIVLTHSLNSACSLAVWLAQQDHGMQTGAVCVHGHGVGPQALRCKELYSSTDQAASNRMAT